MADFPRTVLPADITPFRVPGPFISLGHSGKAQLRSALGAGREWTETWANIQVGTPDVDALLAFIEDAWSQGTAFDIAHLVSPGSGLPPAGVGTGSPLVNGASQTGATLVTDTWSGATNLITNPGFEAGGTLSPHGLVIAAGVIATLSAIAPRSGTNHLHLNPNAQSGEARFQFNSTLTTKAAHPDTVAGAPSALYWEFYARRSSAVDTNQVRARLTYRDDAGTVVGLDRGEFLTLTSGYQAVRVSGTVLSGATYLCPELEVADDGFTNNIFIDDATLIRSYVRAGDVFRVSGLAQLFRASADSVTAVLGAASVPIYPPIVTGASPADNAALTISGATLSAYIAAPPNLPSVRPGRLIEGLTLTFREAL